MSACLRLIRRVCWGVMVVSLSAAAQEVMDRAQIAEKKRILQNEREVITATYETQARQ